MTTVTSSITINRPIQEVFEYMASPRNGPAFTPNLNENTNIVPENPGLGQTFDWRFNVLGIDLQGTAEVTEYSSPNQVVITSKGAADSTWTYTLNEDQGVSTATVRLDYELSLTALQRIANTLLIKRQAQDTVDQMLKNLKTLLET